MGLNLATADDYSHVLHALRPVGPAMVVDDPLLLGLSAEFARIHNRLADLLQESDPRLTYELLADWERAFGLPDACCGSEASYPTRINALVGRVRGAGTPTPQYFIDLAAAVGYNITITEFTAHTVNSDVDYALYGDEICFVWQVNASSATVTELDVTGDVNMALAEWGNAILECVITAAKPAHTLVIFSYS